MAFTEVRGVGLSLGGGRGPRGVKGNKPGHVWMGTSLAFEEPDGSLGDPVDIKGDVGPAGDAVLYASRNQAAAATIPAGLSYLNVGGYTVAGDAGAALYKQVPSEPAHGAKFQSADGRWWEIAEPVIRPAMVGAVGNGATDDTLALSIVMALSALGLIVDWGGSDKVYRTTSALGMTATRAVQWRSAGASILLDSAINVQRAVAVTLDRYDFSLVGMLTIDANEKAFTGLYVSNTNLVRKSNVLIGGGLVVRNCFRASTAMTGGDGIFVHGNLRKVLVKDFEIYRVHMATGAGVSGSQGVSGITVARDNTSSTDADLIVLSDFIVEQVFSDDQSYTMDQDGVRVFTNYSSAGDIPRDCVPIVTRGRIKNAHGRAVKVQSEYSVVSELLIVRNGDIYGTSGTPYYGNPDIDFQVGGGQAANIQCHYQNNYPSRVINCAMTRDATRANPASVHARDVIVNQMGGGTGIDRFMAVNSDFAVQATVTVDGIHIHGSRTPVYGVTLQSASASTRYLVNVKNFNGRGSTAIVYRLGSVAAECLVTGMSICNAGSTVPFAASAVAGSLTSSLLGANRLVS